MLFQGRHPFIEDLHKTQLQKALQYIVKNKIIIPSGHKRSPEIIQLICQMLEKNDNKRIGWPEIFDHALVRPALELELC